MTSHKVDTDFYADSTSAHPTQTRRLHSGIYHQKICMMMSVGRLLPKGREVATHEYSLILRPSSPHHWG